MDETQLLFEADPEPDEQIEVIDSRQFFYIDPRVRREYLATRKISPSAFAVYATLCDFAVVPGPTVAALTAQSGLKSSNTTRKAMRELIKRKLIAVEHVKDKYNHNQPNQYTLLELPPIDTSKNAVPQNLNPAPQKMKGNSLESCIDQSLVSRSDPVLNRDSQRAKAALPSPKARAQRKPKTKDDPETNLAITERIEAYIKGLPAAPATNQYNHTTNRQAALDIFKAGFTPEQVTACTRDKSAEDFWRGKRIPLKTVADDIAAWQHAKERNDNGQGSGTDGVMAGVKRAPAGITHIG